MAYTDELANALTAVSKATKICQKVETFSGQVASYQKTDYSPVTIADFGSQAVMVLEILAAFPEDPIVAEEEAGILRENISICKSVCDLVKEQISGTDTENILAAIDYGSQDPDFSGRFWTMDPIDGTKGFLRGDQYAVALALIENGVPVLGVLGCPNLPIKKGLPESGKGGVFYAVRGAGAFIRSLDGDYEKRISADAITNAHMARFCESVENAHASHGEHQRIAAEIGIAAPPYRIDSQAKYVAVARGDASVYLRLPKNVTYREKIWDHAAGTIIVAEAGGRVSDFSDQPLDFSTGRTLDNNVGILATNGHLHEKAIAAIRKIIRVC